MSFYQTVYDALRPKGDAPEETVLLVNSRAVGRRLLAALAAHCGPLIGVRAATTYNLAEELCAATLHAKGAKRVMDDDEAAERMLECIMKAEGVFNADSASSLAAVREICRNVKELETENVPQLGGSKKLEDLQALRDAYTAVKERDGLWDRADLLRAAAAEAARGKLRLRCVTLPSVGFTVLERRLLDALGGVTVAPCETPQDTELPRHSAGTARPADPLARWQPAEQADGVRALEAVACRGAELEIRFILRDILSNGVAADRCAVICPSTDYELRLYEAAARFGVPLSMARGIPITQTRLFMALRTLAELPQDLYDAEMLRRLLRGDCFPKGAPMLLAEALRTYRVGWGDRKHYEHFLDVYAAEKAPEIDASALTGEEAAAAEKKRTETLERVAQWREWLGWVFTISGSAEQKLDTQREALLAFVQGFARIRFVRGHAEIPSLEIAAQKLATETAEKIRTVPKGDRLLDWLLKLLENKRICTENASPGKLLCIPAAQGLFAGRERLYLPGLSRNAFRDLPESAVLLDQERRKLNDAYGVQLSLAHDSGAERRRGFLELLLHHEGTLVLTYPDFEMDRMAAVEPDVLLTLLCARAGVTPRSVDYIADTPLTAGDRLLDAVVPPPEAPAFAGAAVEPAGLEPEIGFDRWLVEHYIFSATSMEKALTCPFAFYLQFLLHIRQISLPEWKEREWLPKMLIGNLCHLVLKRYYGALRERPAASDEDAAKLLDAVFEEEWASVKDHNPPVSARQEAVEKERSLSMIRAAIAWTAREQRKVLETERGFGVETGGDVAVALQAGKQRFRLSGSIDRVDQLPDGRYAIVDYKTGDPERLKRERDYHLQHYLYSRAEAELSKGKIVPEEAGYLLLAEKEPLLMAAEPGEAELNEKTVEALLEWLRADEAHALEAVPNRIVQGELVHRESAEQEAAAGGCSHYCYFRELCPLKKEGGANDDDD